MTTQGLLVVYIVHYLLRVMCVAISFFKCVIKIDTTACVSVLAHVKIIAVRVLPTMSRFFKPNADRTRLDFEVNVAVVHWPLRRFGFGS